MELTADLLVIGGGVAGLTAAASAARHGLRVILLERNVEIGGSAALSAGYVWTAPTLDVFLAENPLGDPALGRVLVEGLSEALEWVESIDIEVLAPIRVYGWGLGRQIDIVGYLRRCASIVNSSGGLVMCLVDVRSLVRRSDGRIWGARVRDYQGNASILAPTTLLATGGFQANPSLRARHIHRNARSMLLRSNPHSAGHGLRLGTRVGAALTRSMDGFYGHLISSPADHFTHTDFIELSQYHSSFCMLVNWSGDRFTDESAGDRFNVQAVLRQRRARAILVADARILRERINGVDVEGMTPVDKFAVAVAAGARFVKADTHEELARALQSWAVDGAAFLRTLERYNSGIFLPDEPPRRAEHAPIVEPPFYALEVQPAITFTNGGLRVDEYTRALNAVGVPIPGLLAAGADAGGLYNKAYAGGLAMGMVFGRRASTSALENAAQTL